MATTLVSATASAQSDSELVTETIAFAGALMAGMPKGVPWGASSHPLPDGWPAQVLATLPAEGHVTPSPGEQRKLAPTRALLRAVHRGDIVVVVINVPQAFIGLHGRVVLLVSRPALALLSSSELRAVAAHELGHDLLWDQYDHARQNKATAQLRSLELQCDAVAVLILQSESHPVMPLVVGLGKLERFNRSITAVADIGRYPRLELRSRVIAAVEAHGRSAGGLVRRK